MGLKSTTGKLPSFSGPLTAEVPTDTYSGISDASDGNVSINPYTNQGPGVDGEGLTTSQIETARETAAGGVATDEFFSSVVLLMPADDHTDVIGNTVTNFNVTTDTSIKKFGTGSSNFNGSSARYSITDSDDWTVGSGDFTIEAWVWLSSGNGNSVPAIMSQWGSLSSFQFVYEDDGTPRLIFHFFTTAPVQGNRAVSYIMTDNTWTHIALCRDGNNLRFFADGDQQGATQDLTGVTLRNSSRPLLIGGVEGGDNNPAASSYWTGKFDDIRFTKGVARYTANFDVPTEAFPTS